MTAQTPAGALQLRSLVRADQVLEVYLESVAVPEPGPSAVIVRVEAAPVNPSDLGLLLAGADLTAAVATGSGPAVRRSTGREQRASAPTPGKARPKCSSTQALESPPLRSRSRRQPSRPRPTGTTGSTYRRPGTIHSSAPRSPPARPSASACGPRSPSRSHATR